MKSIRTLLASLLILVPGIALAAPVLIYENDGTAFVETYGPDDAYLRFYADPASDPYIWAAGMISGGVLTASLSVSEAPSTVLLESTSIVSYALLDNAPEPDGTPNADTFTVIFDGLTGAAAALFGTQAQVVFTFFIEDEDAGYYDWVNARVYADTPAVPLPATLPLLGLTLAGAALLRRRARV